jgi:phosphoribosylformylglycinamidine synthase
MKKPLSEPKVTPKLVSDHGLSPDEYDRICRILGRIPTYTELGIFSVMWSEHCSYKNSILELKTLPRTGPGLLVGAGEENAGLVDIGDGLAVAFKIESHNHPSALEPYQGAATGVGGIMRDIFSMGARPIASLDSLRFGPLNIDRNRFLLDGVVRGIGDYGNCFGVPTVAGEIYFDPSYSGNPIVNCMSVGLVKHDRIARAIAKGKGNIVMIVGSSTGRDGIHGATFASEELSDASESKRSSVQVGDPFTEKVLLEATLELVQSGCLVGIQDMGAAGITCSTCEMAARGKSGIEIELAHVPVREENMTPYEIMLSESQERMLVVIEKGKEDIAQDIFRKWDLHAAIIGQVADDGIMRVRNHGQVVAEIPAEVLVLGGGAPQYCTPSRKPDWLDSFTAFDPNSLPEPDDYNKTFLNLLGSPTIASKHWVFEQYDTTIRNNTRVPPGKGDAAVLRVKYTRKALSLTTDGNGRYVFLDPRMGGKIAVAEAARNVVCTGARPVAITNCLNFGNPMKPEVYHFFREAVAGMGEACRALETPVTGGNVSFYNESEDSAVLPTPVIGMLGLLDNIEESLNAGFKAAGNQVVMLGELTQALGGSEYLYQQTGETKGPCPSLDLEREKAVQRMCLEANHHGWICAAHDISEGGFSITLAEMCLLSPKNPIGIHTFPFAIARGKKRGVSLRPSEILFSECQSVILVEVKPNDVPALQELAKSMGIPCSVIGTVGGDRFQVTPWIDLSISELVETYFHSLDRTMSRW